MHHHLSLRQPSFDLIATGRKTVEIRVCDPRILRIVPGARLTFTCDDQLCTTEVIETRRYPSIATLLDAEDVAAINPLAGRAEQAAIIRGMYPPAREALGMIALEIRLLP